MVLCFNRIMFVSKNPMRLFYLLALVLLMVGRRNHEMPILRWFGIALIAILYIFFDLSDWLYDEQDDESTGDKDQEP